MNHASNAPANFLNLAGWLFGLIVLAIGTVNIFWGNDPGFGAFIFLLGFVFFPPVNAFITAKTGFTIPRVAKWVLGAFIIWVALGVGELPAKIHLMLTSF